MKPVSFHSHGARIAGVLRLPRSAAPSPVIVMCAGMTLTKEVWLPANADWLCEQGYATLSFDYRGFGASEGARNRLVPSMQVDDVRSAITYLETVSEVDATRVGLFGISLGASVAVATAGVDSRVKATVAVAGPMDLGRVWRAYPAFDSLLAKVVAARRKAAVSGELSYIKLSRLLASDPETCAMIERDAAAIPQWRPEVAFESLSDLFEFRPEAVVAQISPRAVMFVSPAFDALIAGNELRSAFDQAREPKRFVELPGVKHHEVYGAGAGFAPTMVATHEFFSSFLSRSAGR